MNLILMISLFYPLLGDIWSTQPFDQKIDPPESEIFVPTKDVNVQFKYLDRIKDPRVRGETVKMLGLTNNKVVAQELEGILKEEKDQNIVAESLRSIYNQRKIFKPVKIDYYRDNLKNNSQFIRLYSNLVFLNSGGNAYQVFKSLETEDNEFVANMIWNELRNCVIKQDLQKLEGLLKSSFMPNRCGAAYFIGKFESKEKSLKEALDAVSKDDSSVKISFVSGIKAGMNEAGIFCLDKLSDDQIVPVRTAVAENNIVNPLLENVLIKLTEDSDFEVRRLACLTLGNYKSDNSVLTLIKKIADASFFVRTAAEDSLVKLSPQNQFIEMIGGESLDNSVSQDSALRVLGLLCKKEYSEKITGILKDAKLDETIARAIRTLGSFDYKESSDVVVSFADHKNPSVRKAIAWTLGRFNLPETYDLLRKLDKDSDLQVRLEAIRSIALTGNNVFAGILFENLKEYTVSADVRAHTSWAIAKTFSYDKKILSTLERNITQEVIPTPMGSSYDTLFARVSAFWALAALNSKYKDAGEAANKIYSIIQRDTKELGYTSALEYNMYQALCMMDGKKPEPKKLEMQDPLFFFPVNKIKEDKEVK